MVGSEYTQTVLPLRVVCTSLCGGRLFIDACCAGVVGGTGLKPADDSMSSLNFALVSHAATATHSAEMAKIDFHDFIVIPHSNLGRLPPDLARSKGQNPESARPPKTPMYRRSGGGLERRPGILFEHISPLLGYHDRRGIGIARGYGRHDRGVYDPESGDTVHAQPVVHHRHGVAAHLAGADHVIGRLAGVAGVDETLSRGVGVPPPGVVAWTGA